MITVQGSSDVLLQGPRGIRVDALVVTPDAFPTFTVPAGYKYDGASIPPFLWGMVGYPFQQGFRRASAAHDYMLIEQIIPARSAHKIFYQILRLDNVSKWKAVLIFLAVNVYWSVKGWFAKLRTLL